MNSVLLDVNRLVRVPAEDTIGIMLPRVLQSPCGHLRRHAQPARVQPVNEPDNGLAFEIQFLQLEIQRGAQPAEPHIVHLKAIELMTVNRDVPQSGKLPGIALVDAHAHQVRHDVGEPVVVIAFHPYDFNLAFGIRQFADITEELPVFFGQAGKIEVGKNIAQKDQPLKQVFLQHASGFAGMARLRTEVQVGKDQRVVHGQIHNSVVASECYGVMKTASKSVHSNRKVTVSSPARCLARKRTIALTPHLKGPKYERYMENWWLLARPHSCRGEKTVIPTEDKRLNSMNRLTQRIFEKVGGPGSLGLSICYGHNVIPLVR